MKILLINNFLHTKNLNSLLNYDIEVVTIEQSLLDHVDLNKFNAVYSPSKPIDIKKYPNTKFIFGPHFSVLPDNKLEMIKGNNSVYIQPSDWVKNLWKNNHLCNNIKIETLPFGVDTTKFNEVLSIEQRKQIFIYYKSRKPDELQQIMDFLSQFNFEIKIFNYLTRYSEEDYLKCLHNAKFGIWIGRHESQGFALEEALSCNVPLLVWNVTSMNQEYGYNYDNISATTIPYWDNRCGEYFTDVCELQKKYNIFINNLENYTPREYILENLSIKKCSNKFINIVNNIT